MITLDHINHPLAQHKSTLKIKDLEQACCLLGGSKVEGEEGSVGVDRGQEGVAALLLAAERLVHPEAQRVQQLCQNRRPLCDVLLRCVQLRRVPAVWRQDFNIKGGHRKCLQRLGHLGLKGLTADILSGKEMEGVNVDAVCLAC